MTPNQLSGRINVEVTPEQWSSSLTATSWWFWEVLDGTGRSSPNLTYTCVVGATPRLEYITWKDILKRGGSEKRKDYLRTELWLLYNFIVEQDNIIQTPWVIPRTDFLILLVSNNLKLPNLIVFFWNRSSSSIHALQIYCLGRLGLSPILFWDQSNFCPYKT